MIKNAAGKLYTGFSLHPTKRLNKHNTNQGAAFTKNTGNFQTVFVEKYFSLREARKREIQIKKWRREKKELLIMRQSAGLPTIKFLTPSH